MGFRSSILAGVTLIRPAIQSRNYVPGSAGWQISAAGSAEFADMVLRGNGTEVLVVGPDTGPQVVIGADPLGTEGHIEFPTNRPLQDHIATILSAVGNLGAADEYSTLHIEGPSINGFTDRLSLILDSQRDGGTGQAALHITLNDLVDLLVMSKTDTTLSTRTAITPAASAGTVLEVAGAVGHTGLVLDVQAAGSTAFLVDTAGSTEVIGRLDVGGDAEVVGTFDVGGNIETAADFKVSGVVQGRGITRYEAITAATAVFTAETVWLTMLSVAFAAGRAYRVSIKGFSRSTVAADRVRLRVRKTNLAGITYLNTGVGPVQAAAGSDQQFNYTNIIRNSTGGLLTQTLVACAERQGGTGNILIGASAVDPAYLLVEDIGEAADYPAATAIA